MKGNWIKYYLLIGLIFVILLSISGSYAFTSRSIYKAAEKHTFESVYLNTDIDFIIPSPSIEQISEIEGTNGIAYVTPYYETNTDVMIEGAKCKGSAIILIDDNKISHTPYNSDRIISGDVLANGGTAVVDYLYAKNNNCKVGELVEFTVLGNDMVFEIVGITETNTYYKDGTIAFLFNEEQKNFILDAKFNYSAAYVCSTDKAICKNYLVKEYKPLGRLKSIDDFDDATVYEQHVKNFNDADWSQEITICNDNYEALKVTYDNTESSIMTNSFIYAIVAGVTVLVMNVAFLINGSVRKVFQNILVKKGGSLTGIKKFYVSGIVFHVVVFIVLNSYLYYKFVMDTVLGLFDKQIIALVIPAASVTIVSIFMMMISLIFINTNYKVKKQEK